MTLAHTVFGASLNSVDDIARHASWMLQPAGARIFLDSIPKNWNDAGLLRATPTNPVTVSFKYGTATQLAAFLSGKPAGQKANITYYHEPEDNFTTAAQQSEYRAAWGNFGPVIRKAGCTPMLILMAYTLQHGSGRDYHSWYNSSAVDAFGWDMYSHGWKSTKTAPFYTDPAKLLDTVIAHAKVTGKPWAITETGSPIIPSDKSGSQRATWAGKLASAIKAAGGTAALWWDSGDTGFANELDSQTGKAWR